MNIALINNKQVEYDAVGDKQNSYPESKWTCLGKGKYVTVRGHAYNNPNEFYFFKLKKSSRWILN